MNKTLLHDLHEWKYWMALHGIDYSLTEQPVMFPCVAVYKCLKYVRIPEPSEYIITYVYQTDFKP